MWWLHINIVFSEEKLSIKPGVSSSVSEYGIIHEFVGVIYIDLITEIHHK